MLARGWGIKFATGLKYETKSEHFFNKWPLFCSKIGMLRFLGIENLHKEFGVDILKIVDFFLMSNFWSSFLFIFYSLKNKEMTTKSKTIQKNPQFLRYHLQIFCASFLYTKTLAC